MEAAGVSTSVQYVFEKLQQEGELEQDWQDKLDLAIEQSSDVQPWYVRGMIGFGAWLASLLLIISILAGLGTYQNDIVAMTTGLVIVAMATVLRRLSVHDFATQMTLAFCLAGQGLFLFGLYEQWHDFENVLYAVVLTQPLMIMVYPDKIFRFLSVLFCVQAIVLLLFKWNAQEWLHILMFGLLLAFLLQEKNAFLLVARGWYERLVPIAYGLLTAALAILMLSTVYILPELSTRTQFFPYPWLSALLSGPLLIAVIACSLRRQNADQTVWLSCMTMAVLFVLASLQMPGLVVACLLVLLGYERSLRPVLAIGIVFLVVFLTTWFYGLEVSLPAKSISLVSSGALLVLFRYGLRRWYQDGSEVRHA